MHRVFIADPAIIGIGIGEDIRGEHVILYCDRHGSSLLLTVCRAAVGPRPESPRDEAVVSSARKSRARRRPSPGAWFRPTALQVVSGPCRGRPGRTRRGADSRSPT